MNAAVNTEYLELRQQIMPAYMGNIRHDGETLREVINATAKQTGIEIGTVEEVVCGILDMDTSEIDNPRMIFASEVDR